MDKRFFLALLLTAAVVLITPLIFPSPKRSQRPASDTASPRPDSAAAAPALVAGPTSGASALQAPGVPSAGAVATDSARPVTAATVETTTVALPHATYGFSNLGASLVSAQMTGYRSLRRDGAGSAVELARPGQALLRFRLFTGRDTLALDRVPFRVESRPTGADASAPAPLVYSATVGGAHVAIRYEFVPGEYLIRASGRVDGLEQAFLLIDMPHGFRSSEADTLDDLNHTAFAVKQALRDAKGIPFSKLDPGERRVEPGPITWVAAKSKYFLLGVLADSAAPFDEVQIVGGPRVTKIATTASATVVRQLRDGQFGFEVYAGPQEWRRLRAVGRDFENANPYGGWLQKVVQPFATLVMQVLLWMKQTLDISYGWVLVIFGVAIRLLLWPLNQSAMRASLKMQRVQPQLAELQKKYRNDPQKQQQEIMRVYKEHGMSPFSAFSGCLPMLLPMPVLFALFFVFQNTIEFRGVPFLWLPDISLKDPYYILPVLLGISMFVLSWIGMRAAPPNPQTKIMGYVFPVMMTVLFVNFASGLNMYYMVQNVAALPQQWLIARERAKVGGTTTTISGPVRAPATQRR